LGRQEIGMATVVSSFLDGLLVRARSIVRNYRGERFRVLQDPAGLNALRDQARRLHPLRVVLGAGTLPQVGWLETDYPLLDITKAPHWNRLFRRGSIDRLLAEHVLEHLSEAENQQALALAFTYLKPGGVFRIAVPDGCRRDPDYVAEVAPPKDGHQILFTREYLTRLLESAGFCVQALEYFDASERFHAISWDSADGHVHRSVRFDRQEAFRSGELYYTSLIVDAVKPAR
jgi:predicted SAM-dependent methyltransferase